MKTGCLLAAVVVLIANYGCQNRLPDKLTNECLNGIPQAKIVELTAQVSEFKQRVIFAEKALDDSTQDIQRAYQQRDELAAKVATLEKHLSQITEDLAVQKKAVSACSVDLMNCRSDFSTIDKDSVAVQERLNDQIKQCEDSKVELMKSKDGLRTVTGVSIVQPDGTEVCKSFLTGKLFTLPTALNKKDLTCLRTKGTIPKD